MSRYRGRFPAYVPVSERQWRNEELAEMLSLEGRTLQPARPRGRGRKLALSFWGDRWCRHLESFSDYENRLPRGRTYLRHGAVLDLRIEKGLVSGLVSGTELYEVEIRIEPLSQYRKRRFRKICSGRIGSLLELLEGRLSDEVMSLVTDPKRGLLPRAREIEFDCDCPDWAMMCKHVAAVLFGVGVRLDDEPELLFALRGLDPDELIDGDMHLSGSAGAEPSDADLAEEDLGAIFGIDLDAETGDPAPGRRRKSTPSRSSAKKAEGRFVPDAGTIAELRADFGLSIEEFADVLEVSPASVRRWEGAPGVLRLRKRAQRRLEHLAGIRESFQDRG